MLVAFISPVKFSKNAFAVRNFVRSLKFYYKNNFCQSLLLKSPEIRLFYRKLNSRKRGNSLSVFHRNSPKYRNDQRGKLDSNRLKFYGERNTGLRTITAPSYKQPSKLSQLQNTQLNCRWMCKKGKRLTITANFQERNLGSGKKIRPVGRCGGPDEKIPPAQETN